MDSASVASESQDFGDNIRVYVRIRPPSAAEKESGELHAQAVKAISANSLSISLGPNNSAKSADCFTFDHVGGTGTSQAEVFESVGKVIIDSCLCGYNGTIFAYGQTGSGKTFTMQGPLDSGCGAIVHESRGIMPRCFEYLFDVISREEAKSNGSVKYLCKASFCEIYNENIYDLMDTASPSCAIREDLKRGIYIDGLTEEIISSPESALKMLQIGASNRHVAETSMNRESSRSHSVFTLVIQSKITTAELTDVREARFNFVDLAGSERQKLTATTGMRLKEAGNINKSLLALGNVINALVDIAYGKPRHVHYRDSKLTFLLRDSLGGNAKTFIIANICPSAFSYGETLSTLRFASRAKMIKNKAILNQEFQGNVSQLQDEIKRLKQELVQVGQRSSSGIEDLIFDMSQFRGSSSSGEVDNDFRQTLCYLFKRLRQSTREQNSLQLQLETMSKLVESLNNQIRSEKMIIRFRESTIASLKKSSANSLETQNLLNEIGELRKQVESPPELNRFAAENLALRETLARFQEMEEDLKNIEELKKEWIIVETKLGGQIIILNNEIEKLSTRLKESPTFQIEEMQAKLASDMEKIQQYQELKNELEQTISELEFTRNQNGDLQQQLMTQMENYKAVSHQLQDQTKSHQALEEEISKLKETLRGQNDVSAELTDALDQIETLRVQLRDLSSAKESSDHTMERLESDKKSLDDECHKLRQELENERKLIAEMILKYSTEKSENTKNKSLMEELSKTLEEANSEISCLRTQVETLENENIAEENAKLKEQTRILQEYKLKYESCLIQLNDYETEKQKMEANLEMIQEESGIFMEQLQKYEGIERERDDLQAQIQALKDDLWQKNESMQQTEMSLVEERARLQMISDKLSAIDDLQGENKSLEQQLEYILKRNAELEEANAKLVKHNNFKQKLQYHLQIKQENNMLRAENQKLLLELERRDHEKLQIKS